MLKNYIPQDQPLVLASASPRRLELLQRYGIRPQVITAEVDECMDDGVTPELLVMDNAERKALAVGDIAPADALIIAADTVVVLDAKVLGKPADADEAKAMLRALSGQRHSVYTGICLVDNKHGEVISGVQQTVVEFATLSEADIDTYVAGGEPMDKAGAYGIQGQGLFLVERIEGDYGTVMGLSLPLLRSLLESRNLALGVE